MTPPSARRNPHELCGRRPARRRSLGALARAGLVAGTAATIVACGSREPSGAEATAPIAVASTASQAAPPLGLAGSAPAEGAADVAPPAQPAPAEKRRYVVAAIGDSLTDPRSGGGGYLDVLRAQCPESRFENFGRGGDMVNQMKRRFERDVFGRPDAPAYTHLLIFGGVNDLYSDETAGRSNDKIERDIAAMIALARARGAEAIVLTTIPWAGLRRYHTPKRQAATLALNAWMRDLSTRDEARVFDVYPRMSCGEPEWLCPRFAMADGVHVNAEGHQVLGEALAREFFADCR